MTRVFALAMWLCLAGGPAAWSETATRMAAAMTEMRAGRWVESFDAAGPRGGIVWDVIDWHRLREGFGTANEVERFLERRPDWPGLRLLRRRSEAVMGEEASDQRLLDFYLGTSPMTPEGARSYARALRAIGEEGDASAEIVLAWRTMPMGAGIQALFLRDHAPLLKPHHSARLNRLLWDGHLVSARRMLDLVDAGTRKLAEARIALREQAAGVDRRIEAVPEALQDHPGLAYERFLWRVRKNRTADAIDLLLARSDSAQTLGAPGNWARRRVQLARATMRAGDPQLAYRIASSHHTTPEDGYVHADLEWVSGFLALRFLKDPRAAVTHFQRFDAAVETPISKGRAGYWLGRAQDALGQSAAAQESYQSGARYQTSFYGLLAAERAGVSFDPRLQTPPDPGDWRDAAFMESSVVEAGLALLAAGELDLSERFFTHLVEGLAPEQALQLGRMLIDLEQPHLAVMVSKRAARQGIILYGAYYPLHGLSEMRLPMAAEMSLAIARRESEFDPSVISGAGARGLMQIMPATGRLVARDMGVAAAHDTARLISEPDYNARIGATYLAQLAGELGGNVVMIAAGYNAGPGRPRQWMERFGDPRGRDEEAMVDWIEMIPFNETRNYVMRVTESLPVYRARLGQDPLPMPFTRELLGSTLLPFAP